MFDSSAKEVDPSPLLNSHVSYGLIQAGPGIEKLSVNVNEPSFIIPEEEPGASRKTSLGSSFNITTNAVKTTGDSKKKDVTDLQISTKKFRLFLLVGFIATTTLGMDVATNRYLQNKTGGPDTETHLDGSMIITVRACMAWLIWLPFTYKHLKNIFCMKLFFWFAFLHLLNPVLNTYASKYTPAYIVQCLKLTSPFFVALFSWYLKDTIPKYTIPAMMVASVGAFITILGNALQGGTVAFSTSDLIGILLALSAAIVFAMNFVLYTKIKGTVPSIGLTFLENFLQFGVIGSISVGINQGKWLTIWGTFKTEDWVVLGWALIDNLISSFGKIAAVRVIGAPLFSTMAPWQLVVTLFLSVSPLLGETVGPLQIIGVCVVTITLGFYLYQKYKSSQEMAKLAEQKKAEDDERYTADYISDTESATLEYSGGDMLSPRALVSDT